MAETARRRVRLAVTLGDPRGIGPEIAAAAAGRLRSRADRPELCFVGPAGIGMEDEADDFVDIGRWRPEADAATAGRLAGLAIERASALALAGVVDGLVTAPIDKAALYAGGFEYPGHTEMLAEIAGVDTVAMMLVAGMTAAGGPLRVVLATTHVPLAAVPGLLGVERLRDLARVVDAGLRSGWGIDRPRLAFCAVNPHASDGGRFGDEEARILAPAVSDLRAEGILAAGPIPADTVFLRAIRGEFDAVIAPYHDVGMAAFKTVAFGRGVNVTLGLPFVRTAPDHGTALDIAGRRIADPGSMTEALELADRLVRRTSAAPEFRA